MPGKGAAAFRSGSNPAPAGDVVGRPLPGSPTPRPNHPSVRRNSPLKTVLRVDPAVGIGVYTEAAAVRRVLERAGVALTLHEDAVYAVLKPDQIEVAMGLLRAAFPTGR